MAIIKDAIIRHLPSEIVTVYYHIKNLRIRFLNLEQKPPILIYQMGKVGSTTVYRSLQQSGISNPLFHIHFLNEDSINSVMQYHKKKNLPLPGHVFVSSALHKKMIGPSNISWKVITLVRDPIATEISGIFQNMNWLYPDLINGSGSLDRNKIKKLVHKQLSSFNESSNYICTWFDKEIKQTLDINVYNYPFDFQKGYTIIRKNNIELLVLKTENLSHCLLKAMREFIPGKGKFKLIESNIGDAKSYATDYKNIKAHIQLNKDICSRIYSTQYATHFFNEDQINAFTEKWSSPIT